MATEPADAKNPAHTYSSPSSGMQYYPATAGIWPPAGAFFCLLLGQIKKRAALAALFGESDASMRNFRDFFNVGFIDLLFDTICVFIAQQA